MARCKKCGRFGIFLKLNYRGLCPPCESITKASDLLIRLERDRQERKRILDIQRSADLRYFREHFFPMPANNDVLSKMKSVWDDNIHDEDGQLNLQLKSIYEPIAFLVRRDTQDYVFTDYICSEFFYTSPTRCTCKTFKKSRKPCEHMYRLILLQPQMGMPYANPGLDATMYCKFMALSPDCRLDFAEKIKYVGKNGYDYFSSEYLNEEADQGLVLISNDLDYNNLLSKTTKDEIILWLTSQGINGCSFNWSKARVIAWAINNAKPQLEERFSNMVHVSLPSEVQLLKEQYYLERKRSTVNHPLFWDKACHKRQEEEAFGQTYE